MTFEEELMARALKGEDEAGREILLKIALAIDGRLFDSPLFPFLAERLIEFLHEGLPLDTALCVKKEDVGGRPKKYNDDELAAVDILLRDHGDFSPEEAVKWIEKNTGNDRRAVQRRRVQYDSRYSQHPSPLIECFDRETLLHLAGSLRAKVAGVLSGNNPAQV